MSTQTYYAKNGKVHKSPTQRKDDDGKTVIGVGFPVCTMTEWVGDEGAETVAALMNRGESFDALVEALKEARDKAWEADSYTGDPDAGRLIAEACKIIDAALAKAGAP